MKVCTWNKTIINLDTLNTNIWPTELFVNEQEAEKRFLDEYESDKKLKKLSPDSFNNYHELKYRHSSNHPCGLLYEGNYRITWTSCRGERMLTVCTLKQVNL